MDKVTKQHYIPQSYLKAFSEDGEIACYDKTLDKFFPTNITDIAESRYFYDPDTNIATREEQVFDMPLEELESKNAPILKKLRGTCSNISNLYHAPNY